MSFLTRNTRFLTTAFTQRICNNVTISAQTKKDGVSIQKPLPPIQRPFSILTNFYQKSFPQPEIEFVAEKNALVVDEQKECKSVFDNVNKLLATQSEGRLFAIVQLCGKQFKVTSGDIILVEGYWEPTIGDRIRLDKVLLVGANDFTLIGRPILDFGLVDVQATIIEKTLTHTKTNFKKKRRKQYLRINFQRSPNTMIRINSIEIKRNVDEPTKENSMNPMRFC